VVVAKLDTCAVVNAINCFALKAATCVVVKAPIVVEVRLATSLSVSD
jgi:hypothetical protein